MHRKHFLRSILPAGLSIHSMVNLRGSEPGPLPGEESTLVVPAYLYKGDSIGITCPAGFISLEDIQPAVLKLQEWGFVVRPGNTVGKRDFTLGGTDEERLSDLQQMLDDENIKAILCARGGYGLVRIIDKLDFKKFLKHPKWIIGFSDITVMHSHINRHGKVASIHSKMCNSFPSDWNLAEAVQKESIESIRQCITGELMQYKVPANPANRLGMATGALVGGNLKTLESLAGTNSDLQTRHKILFVEDTGEYLYSLDRMFWHLKRTGKLDELKGLIIGGFKIKKDDPGEEFGKTLEQIVLEKVKEFNYPVCFDFPTGHQKYNVALKCGMTHTLTVQSDFTQLVEAR